MYQPNNKLYEDYYVNQAGSGLRSFAGTRFQRGHGLGGIFRSLARIAAPLLTKGAQAVGKQLLKTGKRVAADVAAGSNVKRSLKKRGLEGLEEMFMTGKGHQLTQVKDPKSKPKKRRVLQETVVDSQWPLTLPPGIPQHKRKRRSDNPPICSGTKKAKRPLDALDY